MIYFTSDTHFGHTNIAGPKISNWKSGFRDFNSLHEMNKELLNKINEYVGYDDTLYHLGDFAFGDISKFRQQIVCQDIHLIRGNHDRLKKQKDFDQFTSVDYYKEINYNKIKICLFHYACRVWNKSHAGSILLYGHSHNSINNNYGKSMDVGVDAIYKLTGEYRPISMDEIINIMNKRNIVKVDRH